MAQITLNAPDNLHRAPNTGDGSEFGDNWYTVVANLQTMFTELYTGASTVAGAKTYSGTSTFNSTVTVKAGTGTGSYQPAGNITASANIQSSGTTSTQTLVSYTLPANTLSAVGKELYITAFGTTAGNAAPKKLALVVGGVTFTTATQNANAQPWVLSGTVIKSAANTQHEFFSGNSSGTALVIQQASTDSSVDTGTIAISVTCADASAGTGNIVLYGFSVDFFG